MLDYNELSHGDVGWDEKLSVDAAGGSENGPIETIWTDYYTFFNPFKWYTGITPIWEA